MHHRLQPPWAQADGRQGPSGSLNDHGHEGPRAVLRADWRSVRSGGTGWNTGNGPSHMGPRPGNRVCESPAPSPERWEMQRGPMTVTDARAWQDPWGSGRQRNTTAQGHVARVLATQHIGRRAGHQGNWFADVLGGGTAAEIEYRGDPVQSSKQGIRVVDRREVRLPGLTLQEGTLPAGFKVLPGKGFITVSAFTVCSVTLTSKSNVTGAPQHPTPTGPRTSPSSGVGGRCFPEFRTLLPLSRLTVGDNTGVWRPSPAEVVTEDCPPTPRHQQQPGDTDGTPYQSCAPCAQPALSPAVPLQDQLRPHRHQPSTPTRGQSSVKATGSKFQNAGVPQKTHVPKPPRELSRRSSQKPIQK